MTSSVSWKKQLFTRGEAGAGLASEQLCRAGLGCPGGELVVHGSATCLCSRSLSHVHIASRLRDKTDIEIQKRSLGWVRAEVGNVGGAAKGPGSPSSLERGELPATTPWEGCSRAVDRARLLSEVCRERMRANRHKVKC